MVWPAAGPFAVWDYTPLVDASRIVAHIAGLRDGTLREVAWRDVDGLISMPSFHTAVGLIIPWVLRRHPVSCAVAIVINVGLISGTVLTGVHYLVDVLATVPIFALSVYAYRRLTRPAVIDEDVAADVA